MIHYPASRGEHIIALYLEILHIRNQRFCRREEIPAPHHCTPNIGDIRLCPLHVQNIGLVVFVRAPTIDGKSKM